MALMRVVKPRVSYADLERMPEDGRRYELYDGEVFVVPSPIPLHQVVAQRVWWELEEYVRTHGGLAIMSPIDIVFSEYDVVQPDVVFFTKSRSQLVQMRAPIRDAPDLAIEVLSPATAATDRGKKMQMLARYGVPEYWIVDPIAETVEIYTLVSDTYSLIHTAVSADPLRSPLLTELTFPLARIFPT